MLAGVLLHQNSSWLCCSHKKCVPKSLTHEASPKSYETGKASSPNLIQVIKWYRKQSCFQPAWVWLWFQSYFLKTTVLGWLFVHLGWIHGCWAVFHVDFPGVLPTEKRLWCTLGLWRLKRGACCAASSPSTNLWLRMVFWSSKNSTNTSVLSFGSFETHLGYLMAWSHGSVRKIQ